MRTERRHRITRRLISFGYRVCNNIIELQKHGNYASPSPIANLEINLSVAQKKFQDLQTTIITALLVIELLPTDTASLEELLQSGEGMKRNMGSLSMKATMKPPASTVPSPPAVSFHFSSSICFEFEVWRNALIAYYEASYISLLPVSEAETLL